MITFYKTIRGVEVKIYAKHFVSDYSVGIGTYPEELWAVTLNEDGTEGDVFELTDSEQEELEIEATEAFLDSDY